MSTVGSKTSENAERHAERQPAQAQLPGVAFPEQTELPPVHVPVWVRYLDLAVLALALPVFLLANFPIGGYAVGGGAWIVQRAIQIYVNRKAAASNDPRTIVGLTAGSMIARGWLCAIAIFLTGIIGSSEAGLAAALLVVLLFTVYFALGMVLRPLDSPLRARPAR